MASLENRSVSNLIEIMADERWERLAERQGIAYAKTVAEAMNLKLDMDNPADREKLREQFSVLSPREKCQSKNGMIENSFAVGLLHVYEARRRRWMREISDANSKTQDFPIDEFARFSIEHHELARVFKNHRRGDEAEK